MFFYSDVDFYQKYLWQLLTWQKLPCTIYSSRLMRKLVNQAYEALKNASGETKIEIDYSSYGEDLKNALNAVMGLGFDIEICGTWIW